MPNTMIEIKSVEWTIEGFKGEWADDWTLTPAQVSACADTQHAFLVNETSAMIRGWSYTGAGFAGPLRNNDVIGKIMTLLGASIDFVVDNLDEIKAENPAG